MKKKPQKNENKSNLDETPSFFRLCSKFDSQEQISIVSISSDKIEPKKTKSNQELENLSKNQKNKVLLQKESKKAIIENTIPISDPQEENARQYESFSLNEDYAFVQAIILYQKERPSRQKLLESLSKELERTVCSIRRRWERLSQFSEEERQFICQYYETYKDVAYDRKISFKNSTIVQNLSTENEFLSEEEKTFIKKLKLECLGIEESIYPSSLSSEELEKSVTSEEFENVKSEENENERVSKGSKSSLGKRSCFSGQKECLDFKIEDNGIEQNRLISEEMNQTPRGNKKNESEEKFEYRSPSQIEEKEQQLNENEQENVKSERDDNQLVNEEEDVKSIGQEISQNQHENPVVVSNSIEVKCIAVEEPVQKIPEEVILRNKFKRIKTETILLPSNENITDKLNEFKSTMLEDDKFFEEKSDLMVELLFFFSEKYDCTIDELYGLFTVNQPLNMEEMKVKLCYHNIEKRGH